MKKIKFLKTSEVLQIYEYQVADLGGLCGVRSIELLDSAIYASQATFGKKFLYDDIFVMAAAYAHGIIKNHPFVDGNKRTGMLVAIVFLELNGVVVKFKRDELYDVGIAIAQSQMNIDNIAELLRKRSTSRTHQ